MNKVNVKEKRAIKKSGTKKTIDFNKFDKMFEDIQIDPSKKYTRPFNKENDSTWIISDNNSSFKSFVNYG